VTTHLLDQYLKFEMPLWLLVARKLTGSKQIKREKKRKKEKSSNLLKLKAMI
jgi:hypothetical protein